MRQYFTILLIFCLLCGLAAQPVDQWVALTHSTHRLSVGFSTRVSNAPLEQSFRSEGAFILVEAICDGVAGTFILDTGSPGLVLNRKPLSHDAIAETFGEQTAFEEVVVETFTWGPLHQKQVSAFAVDLSHFEQALEIKIAGLIGYAQLRDFPITIDYPKRLVTFLPDSYVEEGLGVPLPFRFRGHVPTMRATVAGRRARLGLDSGSGINLLDRSFRDAAADGATALPKMIVSGVGASSQQVDRLRVCRTEIDRATWMHMPFAFTCLKGFRESGIDIDGLLGREWMLYRSVTLDYKARRIYVR